MPTIIEMVNHTRLDCVIGASAGYALGDRAGDPPRQPPLRLRQAADRAAADAERARRPRGRVRGGDDQRAVAGARLRRGPRRRRAGRGAVGGSATRRAQVLDLQARAGPRGRGAGVPGRQRLRRGVRDAPALPGEPAGVDLGGIGQRPVPRRAAGDGQEPRTRSRPSSPRSTRRAGPSRGSTPPPPSFARSSPTPRRSKPGRAASSSGWRWRSRARCWSASATRRSPTPSAPPGWAATRAARSAPCRPGSTSAGSSSATRRPSSQTGDLRRRQVSASPRP